MLGAKAGGERSLTKSFTLDSVERDFTDLAKLSLLWPRVFAGGACYLYACFRGLELRGGTEQSNGRLRSRLKAEVTYLRSPQRFNMHKSSHCN